jgi:ribosomal protein L12E/L44/L45/RPP1/RPP2
LEARLVAPEGTIPVEGAVSEKAEGEAASGQPVAEEEEKREKEEEEDSFRGSISQHG